MAGAFPPRPRFQLDRLAGPALLRGGGPEEVIGLIRPVGLSASLHPLLKRDRTGLVGRVPTRPAHCLERGESSGRLERERGAGLSGPVGQPVGNDAPRRVCPDNLERTGLEGVRLADRSGHFPVPFLLHRRQALPGPGRATGAIGLSSIGKVRSFITIKSNATRLRFNLSSVFVGPLSPSLPGLSALLSGSLSPVPSPRLPLPLPGLSALLPGSLLTALQGP